MLRLKRAVVWVLVGFAIGLFVLIVWALQVEPTGESLGDDRVVFIFEAVDSGDAGWLERRLAPLDDDERQFAANRAALVREPTVIAWLIEHGGFDPDPVAFRLLVPFYGQRPAEPASDVVEILDLLETVGVDPCRDLTIDERVWTYAGDLASLAVAHRDDADRNPPAVRAWFAERC